ncbi:hypothetical protein SLA2020_183190 [Shorea laevis]
MSSTSQQNAITLDSSPTIDSIDQHTSAQVHVASCIANAMQQDTNGPSQGNVAPEHCLGLPLSLAQDTSLVENNHSTRPHHMITRSQKGIYKPNPKYIAFHVGTKASNILIEPKSVKSTLKHPGWMKAMHDELTALKENHTWDLVPRTEDMNVIRCKWVFKMKLQADENLDRLEARLVTKGFHQVDGIDFSETFSPIVKPSSIQTVLTIATVKNWSIRQLDVKNAFLHGNLSEQVFMEQPPGFTDEQYPSHVCYLRKALYGLKQAPQAWFDKWSIFLLKLGFSCSIADPSPFTYHTHQGMLPLLIYVDDMILTGSNLTLVEWCISELARELAIKDLGHLHYFLGIEVHTNKFGLFLCQSKYAHELLQKAQMVGCKPISTPMAIKTHSSSLTTSAFQNPTFYRSIIRGLQYLTFTRPDLSFAVNHVSQFMHAPTLEHFQLVKRILRYLGGTLDYGMRISNQSTLELYAFLDTD